MALLQRSVSFPSAYANQAEAFKVPTYGTTIKSPRGNGSGFKGLHISHSQKNMVVSCSLYPSSNESNSSKAGDFKEIDTAYVNASLVETAEVRSSSDGLIVMMKDGKLLRCVHNNLENRHQLDYAQNSPIVLKMDDGSGLLLPICLQLMEAVGDVQVAKPSMYEVVMEMIEKMGHEVKLVRVTGRAIGSYFAQVYLTKVDDNAEDISFELQPSDAINIAIGCKAPIQVDRHMAHSAGLKVVEFAKPASERLSSDDLFCAELDRPVDESCIDAKEFNLLRNMLVAAVEERYHDAALWRDELNRLRSTWLWMFV